MFLHHQQDVLNIAAKHIDSQNVVKTKNTQPQKHEQTKIPK